MKASAAVRTPTKLTALLLGALLSVIGVLAMAPSADAAHHLVRIRQVYPGAGTASEFVVLQLTAPGENQFILGSEIRFYDESGLSGSEPFVANPLNGQSQRTVLVATPDAEDAFQVTADLQLDDSNFLDDDDGAACFFSSFFSSANVDCLAWGDSVPTGPTGIGTPEAAIPAGNMLERSIAANCSTFFETGDDTNQSTADFAPVPITAGSFTPRNNGAAITETTCGSPPPGGGSTAPATPPPTAPKKKKCKKPKKRSAGASAKKCKKKQKK